MRRAAFFNPPGKRKLLTIPIQIFERPVIGDHAGVGPGIAIAKSIGDAHDCWIMVSSNKPFDAVPLIILPIVETY